VRVGALLASLTRLGPHAGAHRVAARAAVSVAVPLLVLYAGDRLEWSVYAAFGAFTSLYGRERVDRHRLQLQAVAGLALVASVVTGAAVAVSDHRGWLSVSVATVVAALVTYVSGRQHWHPPGALFCIFGVSAVAAVPGTWDDLLPALGVAAGAALWSIVVGNVGALVRRVRRTALPTPHERPIGGAPGGLQRHALQAGAGVALAGSIATVVGIGHPYWAMVSAAVPLAARDLSHQLVRGSHRVIGTALGLVTAWVLLRLDLGALGTVVTVVALQAAAELLVGRNYAAALVFITPLALLMIHLVVPTPAGVLLRDRALETVIGVAIGVLVGYLSRPRRRRLGESARA